MKNYALRIQQGWNYSFRILFFAILGTTLFAHGQSTNATIKGKVIDANEDPLLGATIILKNVSTGFTTGSTTNENGDYQLQQLPLGGPYTITAQYLGYQDIINEGFILDLSDVIVVNFSMKESSTVLDAVVVTSNNLGKRIKQLGASTKISAGQIENLPTEGRNFSRLTSLSPLQGGGDINLGGQRRSSTNVTIDGVNFRNTLTAGEIGRGPYTISQEAIREFEVVTNDYDVLQGRQGGGAITAVTKSGTNEFSGSAFFYHRADELQSNFTIQGEEREADFFNSQYGLSLSGPIVKDKLQFFMVYERQDAGDPQFIGNIQSDDDANRLGITRENLDRFLQIGRANYGLSDSQQVGQFDRVTEANNLFVRLDWQINNKHRLTLRNLYNSWDNPLSVSDNSNIEVAESFSDFRSEENSTLLSLRSVFSPKVTNEFKVQYQHAERIFSPNSELPSENIPRAIVQVASTLPNGNDRTISVQLGGQRFTPETNLEDQIQIANTTYLSAGKFNFTFGTDNLITYLETLLSNEQNGRFFFDSLDDFENLNAARFAREVPLQGRPPIVKQTVVDLSLFGQVDVDINPNLNLVAGIRYDATAFLDKAEFNPLVFDELGLRTDETIEDFDNIQPRLQLTWNVKGKNKDILKLGAGLFSAQPVYYLQVNNIQNSGTLLGAVDVTGNNVPTPDFVSYRNDPSTVPGVPVGVTPFSTINAVSPDFEVPTIYKANLSYTHFFGDKYSLGVNTVFSHTANNYVYQEANLVQEPFFVTPEGREVFVPANTISANGRSDFRDSRISNSVGRTLVLTSDGFSDNIALILEGSARIGKDGYLNASFTLNSSRDNSSFNCCVANTSTFLPVPGDPRDLNYGFSDNHFDTKVVVNGATPTWKGFNLGATVIGDGGSRYTFQLGGNRSANGDFNLRNELAFIFDPNDPNTPQNIIDGYNQILNDPDTPDNFKEYLRESFGGFAERNGGKNPFRAIVDLRLQKKFNFNKNNGLQLSADVFNFMNLLNKEWGRSNNFNRSVNIHNINGFDQATNSYQFDVQTGAGTEPINGTPWRLQLGARYTFN